MKKIYSFLLLALTFQFLQAQEKANEIKLNIGNTIAIASVEFGYERFFDDHQSIEAMILINDRFNYKTEGDDRNFNTTSYKIGYNYYFGEELPGSGLYVNPFLKLRNGEFEEEVLLTGSSGTVTKTTDMSSLAIGLGLGYEWNFNNTFVIGPFVNLGRNFSEEVKDRFSAIEFNAGLNIGYRF